MYLRTNISKVVGQCKIQLVLGLIYSLIALQVATSMTPWNLFTRVEAIIIIEVPPEVFQYGNRQNFHQRIFKVTLLVKFRYDFQMSFMELTHQSLNIIDLKLSSVGNRGDEGLAVEP